MNLTVATGVMDFFFALDVWSQLIPYQHMTEKKKWSLVHRSDLSIKKIE